MPIRPLPTLRQGMGFEPTISPSSEWVESNYHRLLPKQPRYHYATSCYSGHDMSSLRP